MKTKVIKIAATAGDTVATAEVPEQTRQKLLRAAEQVFVERGYYDATVREICQRAGLNIAMVNYHFRDKLGLYSEVLRLTSMISRPAPLEHIDNPKANPVVLLRELIIMFLRNMWITDGAFGVLMQQERLRPTPAMEYLIETTMRPTYLAMCALVGRILELAPEHDETRLTTHCVIAQIKHFGEPERLLTQLDPSILSDMTVERLADIIVDFSLASFRLCKATDKSVKKASKPKAQSSVLQSRLVTP